MKFRIIKFQFQTAVHFGNGGLNTTEDTFHADTLFSALCLEAVRDGRERLDDLVRLVETGRILFSDAFPYIGDTLYIPKPMMEVQIERDGDSIQKKRLKKLRYVPADRVDAYLQGKLNVEKEENCFSEAFGRMVFFEKAAVTGLEQANPWGIAAFSYRTGSGLYICIGYEKEEDLASVLDLIAALELTGIGGKVSSGFGKFKAIPVSQKEHGSFLSRLEDRNYNEFMLLSGALPEETVLGQAMEYGSFQVSRRGGFVASAALPATGRKKKDLYLLRAGSVFRERFKGTIANVAEDGSHPVYRYAQAMFMGVTS